MGGRGAARSGVNTTHVAGIVGLGVLAVALLVLDDVSSWSSGAWSAAAAWVTAFLALGAAIVGFRQLREARTLRVEQAQPYVAAFMEPLVAVDQKFQELVVKNFGATAAFNIQIESSPPMQRATDAAGHEVPLPVLPTLVPGQEWRALWDFFPTRDDAGLPDEHLVTVSFEDSRKQPFRLEYKLDWGVNRDRLSVRTYGVHHGVKALQETSQKIGQ